MSMSTNTNTHNDIPATENESWGFWGTMGGYASVAWPIAMTAIAEARTLPEPLSFSAEKLRAAWPNRT